MAVDWDKPIQCCGRQARLLGTLEKCGVRRVVAITRADGSEECACVKDDGVSLSGCFEIINVPQRHVRWVNVYPTTHVTREEADERALPSRIACIRIEFEEGEGL